MVARRSTSRILPWALVLAMALFVRMVMPQGYMLGEDDSGSITVSVCNSGATIVIPLGKPGSADGDHDDPSAASDHCAFAANQAPFTPPDGSAVAPLMAMADAAPDRTRARSLDPVSPRLPPPARAPPHYG